MVFNTVDCNIIIEIDKPGIYCFGGYSSTGKTRVANMLDTISLYDETVSVVGTDIHAKETLILKTSKWLEDKPKLVFVDRFDFICTNELIDLLNKLAETAIILVDAKNTRSNKLNIRNIASIKMEKDNITIC